MATVIKDGRITEEQWVDSDYDNLILAGISRAVVSTGDGANVLRADSSQASSKSEGTAIQSSSIDTGSGNDIVSIVRTNRFSHGIESSKIVLGDGNDRIESSRGAGFNDYYRSSVDCGAGDDVVKGGIPSQSKFTGGDGKDTIVLKGKRSAWDLEFSLGDSTGMEVRTSSGNKISGFEVFVFDDVTFDFSAAPLNGNTLPPIKGIAPTFKSFTDLSGKIWRGMGFDRLTFAGLDKAVACMGDGDNRLIVDSSGATSAGAGTAMNDVEIYAGAGNDTVSILGTYTDSNGIAFSDIYLSDGNDHIESSHGSGRYDYYFSLIDCGAGDDSVDAGIPSQSTFVGGPGRDTITFEGLIDDWDVQVMLDSAGQSYLAVGTNKVYGFQDIQFQKDDAVAPPSSTVDGGKDAADPLAAWRNKPTITGPDDSVVNPVSLRLTASGSGSTLIGGWLSDTLVGGAKADVLIGGGRADTMKGGGGSDMFILDYKDWNQGDRITDFQPSQDRICLTGFPGVATVNADLANPSKRAGVIVTADSDLAAAKTGARFVYSSSSGNLSFNPNGRDPGFGSGGGLIVRLPVGLDLTVQDLMVSEAMLPI